MTNIDKTIADIAHILDCLMAYRLVQKSGSCNDCALLNNQCRYAPRIGEQVRYNCPFYSREEESE